MNSQAYSQQPTAHSPFKHYSLIFFGFLSVSCLLSAVNCPLSYADNENKRAARLDLLKQATGSEDSSSSLYESRVEMMLDRTPSVEREFVENTIPVQAAVQAKVIDTTPTATLLDKLRKEKAAKENDRGKMVTKDQFKSNLNEPFDNKLRMKDEEVQLIENKMKSDEEERRKAPQTTKKEQTESEEQRPTSNLRPSLANNPFYFSEESRRNFEDDKPIIVSRLVQTGYTRLEAENLVSGAGSSEELILSLMQNEGFKYGQAVEVIGTSSEKSEA